jgi:hypothetical protein
MNRPKITIRKNGQDKAVEAFTFLFITFSLLLIGIYFEQLPARAPLPFNWPSIDQNGFGTKILLWLTPLIHGIICVAIYKLNSYPWIFNYPVTITAQNAAVNYKMATHMFRLLSLCIAFMCFTMTLFSIFSGLDKPVAFYGYLEPLYPVLLVGIPIFYSIRIVFINKSAIKKPLEG